MLKDIATPLSSFPPFDRLRINFSLRLKAGTHLANRTQVTKTRNGFPPPRE